MLKLSLESLGQAIELGGWEQKWQQVHQALTDVESLPPGCAYTRGDALTFMRADNAFLSQKAFIAHRRYRAVVMPVNGCVCLEFSPVQFLKPLKLYSDISDSGTYIGSGTVIELSLHEVGLFEVDEALRVLPQPYGQTALIHVTREPQRS